MPTYLFKRRDNQEVVEVFFTMAELERRTRKDGSIRLVKGVIADRVWTAPAFQSPKAWPFHCDASAVHPSQIPEAMEFDKRHGVRVEYDNEGRPIYENQSQRKKYLEAHGMYDRNASYGDPTPTGRKDPDEEFDLAI